MLEAYGMTEAAHQMTSNPLPPAPRKAGSVGGRRAPVRRGRRSVVDTPTGSTGEVVVAGPGVTPGYLGNDKANAASFFDGWFRPATTECSATATCACGDA